MRENFRKFTAGFMSEITAEKFVILWGNVEVVSKSKVNFLHAAYIRFN